MARKKKIWSLQSKRTKQAQLFCCVLHVGKDRNMCELYIITEKGHQWIKAATWASPYKDNYEDLFWLKLWQ